MKYQFRQVINQLKSFTSEFYFTSGYACYLYKIRSYYNDIDICVSQEVFNKIPKIFPQAKIKNITNDIRSFTLNTDKGEIEFAKFDKFFNKKGNIISFGFDSKVTDDLLEIEIENQKCKIISIDWLIILKLFLSTRRKKDQQDINKLMKTTELLNIQRIINVSKTIDIFEDINEILCFLEKELFNFQHHL